MEPAQARGDAVGDARLDPERSALVVTVIDDVGEIRELRIDVVLAVGQRRQARRCQRAGVRARRRIGRQPGRPILVLEFLGMSFLVVEGHARGEADAVAELVRPDQHAGGQLARSALRGRLPEISAERESLGTGQWIARLQFDRAAETALGHRGVRILEHVDAGYEFARNPLERPVLRIAACTPAGALARHVELPAGEKQVPVQRRQILTQSVDQHLRAFALGTAVDLYTRESLQRLGDILVGHLADVLGGNHFNRQVRFPLDVQRILQRLAISGDDDLRQLVGVIPLLGARGARGCGLRRQ